MPAAPLRVDESESLDALQELQVLDTAPEPEFDALVEAAAQACNTPTALVSLIDRDRQWFKAKHGFDGPDQTHRDLSFCAHAVLDDSLMVVEDASQDSRFANHPMVLGEPRIRFYAGAPLRLTSGVRIGTLCVMDFVPRQLDGSQRRALEQLSTAVVRALEGRGAIRRLAAMDDFTGRRGDANDRVESALSTADSAMSRLLTAHRDSLEMAPVSVPLPAPAGQVPVSRDERTTSTAMGLCLTAATALLSIVRRLLWRNAPTTPAGRVTLSNDLADETKRAGRSAYRAGLLLTDPDANDDGQPRG